MSGERYRLTWASSLTIGKTEIVVPKSDSGISFSKFPVSRHLFYDELHKFFYFLCSQFQQKASGWINKTLLRIKKLYNIYEYTGK